MRVGLFARPSLSTSDCSPSERRSDIEISANPPQRRCLNLTMARDSRRFPVVRIGVDAVPSRCSSSPADCRWRFRQYTKFFATTSGALQHVPTQILILHGLGEHALY